MCFVDDARTCWYGSSSNRGWRCLFLLKSSHHLIRVCEVNLWFVDIAVLGEDCKVMMYTHTHTDSERERLGWTVTRLVRLSGYHWLISRVASALERNEEERMTCGELRWIGRSKLLSGYRSRSRLQTDLASRLSIRMSEMVSWGDRVTSSSF